MAERTKPTPGPWLERWYGSGDERGRWIVTKSGWHVARITGNSFLCPNDDVPIIEVKETKANARLIAAAGTAASDVAEMGYDPIEAVRALPELLRELKATAEYVSVAGYASTPTDTRADRTEACERILSRISGKEGE